MPRLGEFLVGDDPVSPEQLDYALDFQAVHGGTLGQILVRLGFATQEQVTSALARKYGVPSVDLERLRLSRAVCRLLPLEQDDSDSHLDLGELAAPGSRHTSRVHSGYGLALQLPVPRRS